MGHSLRLLDKKKRQSTLNMTAKAVETTPKVETKLLGLSIPDFMIPPAPGVTNDDQYQAQVSETLGLNFNSPEFWHPNRGAADMTSLEADRTEAELAVDSRPDPEDASTVVMGGVDDASSAGQIDYGYSFDPRLVRFDAFRTTQGIVPFASDTAASVYFDMVFSIEKAIAKDG